MRSRRGLVLDSWIPFQIVVDHVIGGRDIEPRSTRTGIENQDCRSTHGREAVNYPLAVVDRHATIDDPPKYGQLPFHPHTNPVRHLGEGCEYESFLTRQAY